VLRIGLPRTYDAIFGYANASGADASIPVGRRNLVVPAPFDRGQPSVFRPGVVLNAFAVRNIPRTRNLTWTVRIPNGEIRSATATARFPRNCITAPGPETADLVLTKTVDDAKLTAGQRGTFRIHVLNRRTNRRRFPGFHRLTDARGADRRHRPRRASGRGSSQRRRQPLPLGVRPRTRHGP